MDHAAGEHTMTARRWQMLILAGVLMAMPDRVALGCSCGGSGGPACQAAWTADAVFSGTVVSIARVEADGAERRSPSMLVTFQIDRGFINAAAGSVSILTGTSGGDCGYPFKAGERYLVYANRTSGAGLTTGICSRTRTLATAQEDLQYLTSIPAASEGGRIFGRITESRRAPAEELAVDYGPVEGVTVSVHGSAFTRDAVTGTDGRFVVPHLPPGPLRVTVFASTGFDTRDLERELVIRDPRACGQAD